MAKVKGCKPARNKPRGNILEGNYPMQWTGPLYLS